MVTVWSILADTRPIVHSECDTNLQVLTNQKTKQQPLTEKKIKPYLPISPQNQVLAVDDELPRKAGHEYDPLSYCYPENPSAESLSR